jgi:hypothetical protein
MQKAERRTLYCSRCDDAVSALMPWSGWKNALRVWGVGVPVLGLLTPFWGADFCIMIPSSFAYLIAGSVLFRLAGEKPVCSVCSLELDGAQGGTAIRPRPARP